jgi:hypothetical protein
MNTLYVQQALSRFPIALLADPKVVTVTTTRVQCHNKSTRRCGQSLGRAGPSLLKQESIQYTHVPCHGQVVQILAAFDFFFFFPGRSATPPSDTMSTSLDLRFLAPPARNASVERLLASASRPLPAEPHYKNQHSLIKSSSLE